MRAGVRAKDIVVGDGPVADPNSTVTIRYDGFLNRGEPFQVGFEHTFSLSDRSVIAGLRYGIEGMRAGGRRRVRVSPHLAYGEAGVPGIIPPNAVLVFEVELLAVSVR